MAASIINNYQYQIDSTNSRTRNFYITGSTQMYDMHNQIPLNEPHFCVVAHDVMQARTTYDVTGHGYCVRIDSDVTDFVLMAGYFLVLLRISGNAVTRRIRVGLGDY